jgi:hypothetical protein
MLDQAEAVGDLLRHEHRVDEMDFKQRPLYLTPRSAARASASRTGTTSRARCAAGRQERPVTTTTATSCSRCRTITEIEEQGVLRDHSTFEVVDPRDFVCTRARGAPAVRAGGAQYLFHRCWYSFEQLKMLEASGFVKNVDCSRSRSTSPSEYADRETELWNINRTRI